MAPRTKQRPTPPPLYRVFAHTFSRLLVNTISSGVSHEATCPPPTLSCVYSVWAPLHKATSAPPPISCMCSYLQTPTRLLSGPRTERRPPPLIYFLYSIFSQRYRGYLHTPTRFLSGLGVRLRTSLYTNPHSRTRSEFLRFSASTFKSLRTGLVYRNWHFQVLKIPLQLAGFRRG